MKTTERTGPDEQPLSQDILYAVRYYLGGRTGLLVLIGAVLAAGLALNWSWLLAIGVAPLLLALAPCAIMGALGLCGARTTGQSCGSQTNAEQIDPPVRTMAKTPSGALPSADSGQKPKQMRRKRATADAPAQGRSAAKPSAKKRKSSLAAAESADAKMVPIKPPVAVHEDRPGRPAEAAKHLIRDRGFSGEQIAKIWDLSDGCGGEEGHVH